VFVWLSKVLDWFAAPLTWALLLAAAAATVRRRAELAWSLAGAGAVALVLFSTGPVANALQRAVERGVRTTYRSEAVYDAVIVLSGMVDVPASRTSGETELVAEADRIVRAFELLRAGRARNVLLSGGSARPQRGEVPEADRLAAKLAQWGISPERIAVEASSRNTRENAIESARVAHARGWRKLLIVTSAQHVPRALGCFRAVGIEPDVLPVDRRANDGRDQGWLPRAWALDQSTNVIREMAGRVVYRIVGYSK
jgi:uncharacterized SAM-binding protein YcdF (DUF218 family)